MEKGDEPAITIHAIVFGTMHPHLERFVEIQVKQFFSGYGIAARVHLSHYEKLPDTVDANRQQTSSGGYLYFLDVFDPNDPHVLRLGIIDEDLFSDSRPSLNFIFGEARVGGKSCIISITRLDPRYYGLEKNQKLFHERVIKEAMHELGHVIGLEHCNDVTCIMHFSNCIDDTDIKHLQPCDACAGKMKILVKKRDNFTRGRVSGPS